ncbi:hypothetical protein [uncultured Gammaproteobacteria bacterium]|nr:hypothetical protein [uncultured Gammaproteobacteria bacterium]CAC9513844.1 hypothetical protein [uncultured Gammaproteobacteria bacterium]
MVLPLANTNGMIEHLRSISQATATAKGRVAVVIMDRAEQHGIPLEKLNVLIISFQLHYRHILQSLIQ